MSPLSHHRFGLYLTLVCYLKRLLLKDNNFCHFHCSTGKFYQQVHKCWTCVVLCESGRTMLKQSIAADIIMNWNDFLKFCLSIRKYQFQTLCSHDTAFKSVHITCANTCSKSPLQKYTILPLFVFLSTLKRLFSNKKLRGKPAFPFKQMNQFFSQN